MWCRPLCCEELFNNTRVVCRTVRSESFGEHVRQFSIRRDPKVREHDVDVLLEASIDGAGAGRLKVNVRSLPCLDVRNVPFHLLQRRKLELSPPECGKPKRSDLRRRHMHKAVVEACEAQVRDLRVHYMSVELGSVVVSFEQGSHCIVQERECW